MFNEIRGDEVLKTFVFIQLIWDSASPRGVGRREFLDVLDYL